jgi:hypothetical protein
MRAGVDPARQARHDGEARRGEIVGDAFGEFDAGRRRITGADDPDHGRCQNLGLAAHAEKRRRVVDHREPLRIAGFAERDQRDPEASRGFDLALGLLDGADAPGLLRAAAPRQARQGVERGFGAAGMIEERTEGAGTHIVATNKPQPVEPLPVRQPCPRHERLCRH